MVYRVIPLGRYPERLFSHIRSAGCIVRRDDTAVRGPVALVGEGRVWAVAQLRDVTPVRLGTPKPGEGLPQSYIWSIKDVRPVEGIAAANTKAMFLNGDRLEPCFLQAGAQAELNQQFAPVEAETRILVSEPLMEKSAVISECGKYRYELRRIWEVSKGLVNFIMLNPSTADASESDPTMTRCLNFARDWGYGGIILTNLFAYRLTDSKRLKQVAAPEGSEIWKYVGAAAKDAQLVIAAWSDHKMARIQGEKMRRFIEAELGLELKCIKQTKPGVPWHPLYLPGDLKPIPFLPFEAAMEILITEDVPAAFADTSAQKLPEEESRDLFASPMPPDYVPDVKGLSKKERKLVEAGQLGMVF